MRKQFSSICRKQIHQLAPVYPSLFREEFPVVIRLPFVSLSDLNGKRYFRPFRMNNFDFT